MRSKTPTTNALKLITYLVSVELKHAQLIALLQFELPLLPQRLEFTIRLVQLLVEALDARRCTLKVGVPGKATGSTSATCGGGGGGGGGGGDGGASFVCVRGGRKRRMKLVKTNQIQQRQQQQQQKHTRVYAFDIGCRELKRLLNY